MSSNLQWKYTHSELIVNIEWSVHSCLTQLYDDIDMYIIYYIKNIYLLKYIYKLSVHLHIISTNIR